MNCRGVSFHNATIDINRKILAGKNSRTILCPLELKILLYFINHANRVVSINELVEVVWEGAMTPNTLANVYVQMSRLRKKIRKACNQELFKTITRVGYILRGS